MSTLLQLLPGSLPSGYCWPSTPQEFANDIFAISSAVFGGEFQTFNFGDTTPTGDNVNYPWFRTISGYPDRWYVYYGGSWISKHPVPAEGNERHLWVGTEAQLKTYDGGADVAVGDWTGPFWEIDTDFAARSPMAPGTLSGSGTVLGVGVNHGNERVTLTTNELPAHTHTISAKTGLDIDDARDTSRTLFGKGETDPTEFSSERPTGTTGSGNPFSIVHPVRGAYIIKRTARIYYKV